MAVAHDPPRRAHRGWSGDRLLRPQAILITAGADVTVSGTSGDDDIVVTARMPPTGQFTVDAGTMEIHHVGLPSNSLTIDAGGGTDTVTISGVNGVLNLGSSSLR